MKADWRRDPAAVPAGLAERVATPFEPRRQLLEAIAPG